MEVSLEELRATASAALARYGYAEDEIGIILDVLMYAQLRGNNQGVVKLLPPGIPRGDDVEPLSVIREGASYALLDAGRNHAMVAVNRAVDLAMSKAVESGVAAVSIRGIRTSSGAVGYYARRMAAEGLIGIVMAGAPAQVAPAGSFEPVLGTNPLAVSVPTSRQPVVLDMATAAMAFFGVVEARTAGRSLPEGVAYDSEGHPTVDPTAAMSGALRTFDGIKASGLSFMVQALTGPLSGASFAGVGDTVNDWGGHLVIAIDPVQFVGRAEFVSSMDALVARIHSSKRLPDVDEILVPGERGDRAEEAAYRGGVVEIDDALFSGLVSVARGESSS